MGVGWLGFAKGASRTALDSITAREEEDSKKKLLELQEKLRRETSEVEFKRDVKREIDREDRALNKPKDNIYDPTSGKVKILDSMGRTVSERDALQSERDAYDMDKAKGQLDMDVKRANIRQSDASAASSYASADYSRKAGNAVGRKGSLDADASSKITPSSVHDALMARYKPEAAAAVADREDIGTIDVYNEGLKLVSTLAAQGLKPNQIEPLYLEYLKNLRNRTKARK